MSCHLGGFRIHIPAKTVSARFCVRRVLESSVHRGDPFVEGGAVLLWPLAVGLRLLFAVHMFQ